MSPENGWVIMDIDTLYPLVTEAIRQAEALEACDDPAAREAFFEVSRLEEHIARVVPLSDYEGVIARRGAVRAAIKAHHCGRALELVAHFEAEEGIDEELAADLMALKAQAIALAMEDQERLVHLVGPRHLAEGGASDTNWRASAADDTAMEDIGVGPMVAPTAIELGREQLHHKVAVRLTYGVIGSIGLLALVALVVPADRRTFVFDISISLVPALIGVYGTIMGFYFGEGKLLARRSHSSFARVGPASLDLGTAERTARMDSRASKDDVAG